MPSSAGRGPSRLVRARFPCREDGHGQDLVPVVRAFRMLEGALEQLLAAADPGAEEFDLASQRERPREAGVIPELA